METLIVYPKDERQLAAVEAALKELDVPFLKEEEGIYDPEFVTKIEKSKKQVEAGKVTRVNKEDLENFLGL